MSLLKIINFPAPRLREVTTPVAAVDENIKKLAEDMLETMYHNDGAGLAANQVDLSHRIFVMDCSDNNNKPLVLINPEIISTSGTVTNREGCLSFPGIYPKVTRAEKLVVRYFDQFGKEQEMGVDKLSAKCVQHELDHLNGKVFIDYLSPLKQKLVRKKLEKVLKSIERRAVNQ